jgi:hypothetical protein
VTLEAARAVADAVLFEGYALYPYRASALKNQLRWQFGVLAPRAAVEDPDGTFASERWWIESQCLVAPAPAAGGAGVTVEGQLRFLQARPREIERAVAEGGGPPLFQPVPSMEVAGRLLLSWDEGAVREVGLGYALRRAPPPSLAVPAANEQVTGFSLPHQTAVELLRDEAGRLAGRATRRQQRLSGRIRIAATPINAERPLYRLSVRVENLSPRARAGAPAPGARPAPRDEMLRGAFIGTHLLLAVSGGAFVSLLDPPDWARAAAASCRSVGTYPVLAGPPGCDDLVLSAPIILYDHPRVAPESPGDLFDATEIDEILTLRTRALTDDEKREARATDARAAALIDRIDAMPAEQMARLHGAVRPPDAAVAPRRAAWAAGDRVRLRPGARRADVQDMFLDGQIATVEAVMADVEGRECLAVLVDADPATELLRWHGRHLYFYPDEVEALSRAAAPPGGRP